MTTVIVKVFWKGKYVNKRHFRTWHERQDPYRFANPHIAHLKGMGFDVQVEAYTVGVGRVL